MRGPPLVARRVGIGVGIGIGIGIGIGGSFRSTTNPSPSPIDEAAAITITITHHDSKARQHMKHLAVSHGLRRAHSVGRHGAYIRPASELTRIP